MKNFILTLLMATFLSVGLGSCAFFGNLFGEDTVLTTQDQLKEGEQGAIVPWDQLPEDIKDKIPEGTALVMAEKDQLVENAGYISTTPTDEEDMGGLINAVFGIATTFLPSLAAWEGVIALFSQRKRKHYVKAVKSLVPIDTNMDFGGALSGVAAALGMTHSSENSATAFEEDEEEESGLA